MEEKNWTFFCFFHFIFSKQSKKQIESKQKQNRGKKKKGRREGKKKEK